MGVGPSQQTEIMYEKVKFLDDGKRIMDLFIGMG